jgi:hypothetical protein
VPTMRPKAPARNPTQARLTQTSVPQGLITDTPMEQVSISFPRVDGRRHDIGSRHSRLAGSRCQGHSLVT